MYNGSHISEQCPSTFGNKNTTEQQHKQGNNKQTRLYFVLQDKTI